MPVPEMIECWNCGKNYDPAEYECCPKCHKYEDEEEFEDNDFEIEED